MRKEKEKKRPNKSSIIKVIISNFDDKQVKEIKVLYNKYSGIDVIKFNGTEPDENGRMKFNFNKAYNRLEDEETNFIGQKDEKSFFVDTNEDKTELYVTKQNKITGEIIRKYTIRGKYSDIKSGNKKVTVSVFDNKDYSNFKDLNDKLRRSRSFDAETNRVLLDADLINRYRQIVCSDLEKVDENIIIDSQEIYKINKFLTYRSNMIIYYQMINNLLMKGYQPKNKKENKKRNSLIEEIWHYEAGYIKKDEKDKLLNEATKYIYSLGNRFIDNNKKKDPNSNIGEKININAEMIKEDLGKILVLFSRFRHSLVHYNYKFYEKLYTGKDFTIAGSNAKNERKLSELLDLNIFKELSKIKLYKVRAKTNYLDRNSRLFVLGQSVKAIELLNVYRDICERKNGFNNFINSMLITSGEEDINFKKNIINHFSRNMERLSKNIEGIMKEKDFNKNKDKQKKVNSLKYRLREQEKLKKWFDAPYVYDIHTSKSYKDLYNRRKRLVSKYSKYIEEGISNDNRQKLSDLNKNLAKLNKDMKEMTKLNAKYRLQYKMQLAFGFINEEFDLNIKDFKHEFKKDDEVTILEYINKKDDYLNSTLLINSKKGLGDIIKNYEYMDAEEIYSNDKDNNLVKLYTLMFLLLPNEIRGDFLGFAKKNYYDMKHVDFIDKEDSDDKDTFFHDLRLFEKNIKNIEVINYSLSSIFLTTKLKEKFEESFKKIIKDALKMKETDIIKDIDKHSNYLILPLMKNYQIIFKLLNDIEISALFKIAQKRCSQANNPFKGAIKRVKVEGKSKNINFSQLMKIALNEKAPNKDGIYQIRNNIAHINMKELYLDPLNNEPGYTTISEQIEKIIDVCVYRGLTGKELNKNIINDYYMKKERLVFNLKLRKQDDIVSIDRQDNLGYKTSILKKHELDHKNINLEEIIKKIKALKKGSKNTKDGSKGKSSKKTQQTNKDITSLEGIIKKYIIFKIKEMALDIIQNNEYRYVNIEIYDKISRQNHNIALKVNDKRIVINCYDNKNYENMMGRVNFEIKYIQNSQVKYIKYYDKNKNIDLKINDELLAANYYEDLYIDGKVNLVVEYTDGCKVLYINIQDKKYNINLEFDKKNLIICFDKDIKKNKERIDLEYKYIQNIKFFIS